MKRSLSKNQHGFGTAGIVIAVAVAALIVTIAWFVLQNSKKDTSNVPDAFKNVTCDYKDKDLCAFFAARKAAAKYSVAYTAGSGPEQTVSTVHAESATKYSFKITGATNYETVTIDDAYYIKSASGTWWKQTIPKADADAYAPHLNDKLTEPTTEGTATNSPYYEAQGKEACGSLQCFKYQVIDPTDTSSKAYIWFDDQDYKLRRMQNTGKTNPFNATYDYDNVSITAPSPSQDLAPNQYLAPGQSEPTTTTDNQQPPTLPEDYQYE